MSAKDAAPLFLNLGKMPSLCPKGCDEAVVKRAHPFVMKQLNVQKFKCPYHGCDKVLFYEDCIAHMDKCDTVPHPCPNGCGEFYALKDMK